MNTIGRFKILVDYSECSSAYNYGSQTWVDTSDAGVHRIYSSKVENLDWVQAVDDDLDWDNSSIHEENWVDPDEYERRNYQTSNMTGSTGISGVS